MKRRDPPAGCTTARLLGLGLLLFAACAPAAAGWQIAGGTIELKLNHAVLDPMGIEFEVVRPLASVPPSHPLAYRSVTFEGLTLQKIGFDAPHGGIEAFTDGYLQYHGGLILQAGSRTLDATDFRMAPHPDFPTRFRLLDRSGTPWAVLDHGHFELVDDRTRLEIRHANLSMTDALATSIGQPRLAGQVIGAVYVSAPVVRSAAIAPVRGSQCSAPNWPTDEGFEADVSLIGMAQYFSDPAVGSVGCPEACDGASGVVAVTPNATLENTGTADVPWWEQFTGPEPPYDNDQHPYLIWNLYRLSDGRFDQIGMSGLKHAFNSINVNCPCSGGNIVWVGCRDVYSITSNNISKYLAPRSEVVPATAEWGRCGSLFDADCDGSQDGESTEPFGNRMLVHESDLANPDARYFIEAWYVVRDDIDRFNTMGWREIDPEWTGSMWTFPVVGNFSQGPAVDAWTPGGGSTAQFDRALLETSDGAITVVVRAAETDAGRWRYDYFVMNHDFMRAETAGSDPDLQVLSNIGFTAVELPRDPAGTVRSTAFARADRTQGGDWTPAVESDAVRWTDPGDTPLDWGRGFRFAVVADEEPGPTTLRLIPGDGSAVLGAGILGPALPEPLFDDGFESP